MRARLTGNRLAENHLILQGGESGSGTLIAPVPDFFETFATGLLKQADAVADVLKFVNISPDFSLPVFFMNRVLTTGGAAGVKLAHNRAGWRSVRAGQLDEDTPHFLDVFVGVDDVLVTEQKAKSQLAGFGLGLSAGLKGSVFRAQLFNGITGHPEAFFSGHFLPRIAGAGRVT